MMDAINFRRFQCLYNELAGCSHIETGKRKKKLLIHSNPFGYFLFMFAIINSGNPFVYKVNVIRDRILSNQKMVFGNIPIFPGI
jgi:hypothetical protein